MASGRIQARIEPGLQQRAEAVIHNSGYTVSKLFTVIYSYIAETKELPIRIEKIPNAMTLKAIRNVEKKKKLKSYKTGRAGLKALGF